MKKLFMLVMSCVVVLSLTACSKKVKLETKSVNGISLSVPDDMKDFVDNSGSMLASGPNSSIVITGVSIADLPMSDFTSELYAEMMGTQFTDINIIKFDNNAIIDSVPTIKIEYTATSSKDQKMTITALLMYLDGDQFQMVQLTYLTDKESSVKKNLDKIVSSIQFE